MTTHTIELPDPKFQKNDVVRWNRLILHVNAVQAEGRWVFQNGEHGLDWDGSFRYDVTVQQGKGLANNPIRPGTNLRFSEVYADGETSSASFGSAEKVAWDNPIIVGDSIDNISERERCWDARSLVEKHGGDVTYVFRNLGCNIAPENKLWCVTGCNNRPDGGVGVLEWCYDEKDANKLLSRMQLDPTLTDLKAEKHV